MVCNILEWFEGLMLICWYCIRVVLLWIVSCYENGYLLIICMNMSFALVLRHGCEKCYVIRGCTILRDISCFAMDTRFWWEVSCAAIDTIYGGSYRTPNRCIDRYVLHEYQTERQLVCIIRSDASLYLRLHSLHCTFLLFDEPDLVFWWSCVLKELRSLKI